MSGIYIHIPYCKKVCNYCDFHFSASLRNKEQMVSSICAELELQHNYLNESPLVNTIYFGGGTPSVLTLKEIERIITLIFSKFHISENPEFTFEANPDDLNLDYLAGLKSLGINRLSIGVQSFLDTDLQWMNRRHNAEEAVKSVHQARKCGFDNINIDLIYGLPHSDILNWIKNLQTFQSLAIPHLSAYHLTIEPKTVLGVWKKQGKVAELSEDESIRQYEILLESLDKWDFLNYEISNFCKKGYYSQHNLNYWNQGLYLGIGPSAHSYNGNSRQWNIAVNQEYINKLGSNEIWFEKEELTERDKFNDYLLTHFRTMWGIDLEFVKSRFGNLMHKYLIKEMRQFVDGDMLHTENNRVCLSQKGKFIANHIISGLMYVD